MNLAQLVRRVWTESGRPGSGPASITNAGGDALFILDKVADAWVSIQRMPRGWRWMRATAVVALPAQMAHVRTVFDATRFGQFAPETDDYTPTAFLASNPASEWGLKHLEWERFRQRFVVGQHTTGPPQFWSVGPGGDLYIGPTPDAEYTYRFDYRKSLQRLAADNDTPEMPEDHHPAIVWRALMSISSSDAQGNTYARAAGEYEDAEADLILDQGDRIRVRRYLG